jgi:hypothetical protein
MSVEESIKTYTLLNSNESPLKKLKIWDAIISWRDHLIQRNDMLLKTKDNYLCGIYKLIEAKPEILEQNLQSYLRGEGINFREILFSKKDWKEKTIRLREDQLTQLMAHVLSHLHYIQSEEAIPRDQLGEIDLKIVKHMLSTTRVLTEIKSLSVDQIVSFFYELKSINIRDYIISKLIWTAKLPLGVVLELKIQNLIEDKNAIQVPRSDQFKLAPEIFHDMRPFLYQRFKAEANKHNYHNTNNLEDILIQEPAALNKLISELIKDEFVFDEDFLFQTRTGKPVNYNQILNTMEIASRKANLEFDMTPRILYKHAIASGKEVYRLVRGAICREYTEEISKKYIDLVDRTQNQKIYNNQID